MTDNSYTLGPDQDGHFGRYGGRYVAETLMPLILDLDRTWQEARGDPASGTRSTSWGEITSAGPARSISPNG